MNDRSSGLHDQSSKSAERLPSYRPPTGHTRNRVKTGGSRPFGRARWCASAIRETEPSRPLLAQRHDVQWSSI